MLLRMWAACCCRSMRKWSGAATMRLPALPLPPPLLKGREDPGGSMLPESGLGADSWGARLLVSVMPALAGRSRTAVSSTAMWGLGSWEAAAVVVRCSMLTWILHVAKILNACTVIDKAEDLCL